MIKLFMAICFGFLSLNSFANVDSQEKLACSKLSKTCSVCVDGSKRDPKDHKKILEISDYACAKGDLSHDKKPRSFMDKDTCINLSEFCSVCADQKFRFVKKDNKHKSLQEISSDLYECATEPRTKILQR